jgi:hypothetical protein
MCSAECLHLYMNTMCSAECLHLHMNTMCSAECLHLHMNTMCSAECLHLHMNTMCSAECLHLHMNTMCTAACLHLHETFKSALDELLLRTALPHSPPPRGMGPSNKLYHTLSCLKCRHGKFSRFVSMLLP